jgi:hypothetical protein
MPRVRAQADFGEALVIVGGEELQRLMDRLRAITVGPTGFLPVVATPLTG